ncbi:hypothetical protein BT63DRAFT_429534 [Microthyrium microscopicum]|uniref:Uncharacterized protein n=1 Tax=Microthyrium microscopicum TaxID=703497 RepID=A0A6A6U1I6_9PEZI|nr:hypothetical protein BT63DRAFT_429534 [Microthyrium microscopicum]
MPPLRGFQPALARLRDASANILHALPNPLHRRQNAATSDPTLGTFIPSTYAGLNSGPAPGAVAGIVLGSLAAFTFIIWIIYWATTLNKDTFDGTEEVIEVRDRPRRRRSRRVDGDIRRRSMSPPRRRSQIIVEEREERVLPRSRAGSHMGSRIVSRGPSPSPPGVEEVYVERRGPRRSRDEEVIVIEESDLSSLPPPRRGGRRRSSGGYGGGRPASRRYS